MLAALAFCCTTPLASFLGSPSLLPQEGNFVGRHIYLGITRTGSCTRWEFEVLPPRQVNQRDVGVLFLPAEDDLVSVGRHVEVFVDDQFAAKVCEPALLAGLEVLHPEVFVQDLSF